MNPTVKRLLAKKKLSGKDIGRLLIANMIDIYDGDSLPHEKIMALVQSIQTEKDSIDYQLYGQVFFAIDVARDLCAEKIKQAHIACSGLRLFDEAVFFANAVYPDCRWNKYQLGKMTQETRDMGVDLWVRLRNSVQAIFATKGAFMAASEWLKIPGLETVLPDDNKLRLQVDALDECVLQAREMFDKMDLPEELLFEAHEIFSPLHYGLGQIDEEGIARAKKIFKLATFNIDIERAIEMLNPYYEADE